MKPRLTTDRRFRLIYELELQEKGKIAFGISYGLKDTKNIQLTNWQGLILPIANTKFMQDYKIDITCGPNYPKAPPRLRFVNKINLPCVDQQSGRVLKQKLQILRSWND